MSEEKQPDASDADGQEEQDQLRPDEVARISAVIAIAEEQEHARAERIEDEAPAPQGAFAQNIGPFSEELSTPASPVVRPLSLGFDDAIVELTPEDDLAELVAERTRYENRRALRLSVDHEDFHPRIDCDALLGPGTKVLLAGVEVVLLTDSPVAAPLFRNEAVLAEHLAQVRSLAQNADFMRNRYNGNGSPIGVNEAHGANRLDARIKELEEVCAKRAAVRELLNAKPPEPVAADDSEKVE